MSIRVFGGGEVLISMLLCGAMLAFAPTSFGQGQGMGGTPSQPPSQQTSGASQQASQTSTIDPQEDAAYKVFNAVSTHESKKKTQLGKAFLEKYSTSSYTAMVYDQLVKAHFLAQDWGNFFAAADKAIAINPNDLNVLPLVGWVIPRNYKEGQPDGQKQLDRAETYDKTTIQILATMVKPAALTEDRFAQLTSSALSQAHSGLGLIYFNEQKPDEAAKELQQVTAPDATDWFILGASYEMLDKHADAADAFKKCSASPGALQPTCQKNADDASKEAAAK